MDHVLREILDGAHLWQPDDLAPAVEAAVSRAGLHARVWLVDYEQSALHALPHPGSVRPDPLPVDGSLAGRVFGRVRAAESGDGDARRWWVPMVDGTDRLGVVEFTGAEAEQVPDLELVAGLVGHLVATVMTRGELLESLRAAGPFDSFGDPVDPPVWLWRAARDWTLTPERAI